MSKSAYIKLVEQSTVTKLSLDDVKQKLHRYIDMTTKTGQQLAWQYADVAFPYTIEEKEEAKGKWFYLKGKNPEMYKYIVIGIGSKKITDDPESPEIANSTADDESDAAEHEAHEQYYIQVVLPDGATHGDVSKANEYCKYLAKEFKAQLLLFNGRLMYYYPRKL